MVNEARNEVAREEVDYIKDLIARDEDGKIYMMPIIEQFKDGKGNCKPSTSLVFLGEPLESLSNGEVGYNFVVPCPPLCDDRTGEPYDFVCE